MIFWRVLFQTRRWERAICGTVSGMGRTGEWQDERLDRGKGWYVLLETVGFAQPTAHSIRPSRGGDTLCTWCSRL